MTSLAEIRAKYPQYSVLNDEELAGKLYSKFYSDTISRDDFNKRIGFEPPAPKATEPVDLASEALTPARGFNKGVAEVVSAPWRAIDWVGEKLTGTDFLPNVEDMPAWRYYLKPREAQTTVGKYAQAAGEGVGASAVPIGVVAGAARTAAAPAAKTVLGRVGQDAVRFARTNPGTAAAAEVAGGAGQGIGVTAADDAGAPEWLKPIVGLVSGGAAAAPFIGRGTSRIGTEAAESLADDRAAATVRDIQSFDDQGIRQFGPAYNQGATAATARQLAESLPGAPLRNNLDESYKGAADATARLADDLGGRRSVEDVGVTIGNALDRYANASLHQLDAEDVHAIGISPQSARATRLRGGAGQNRRLAADDEEMRRVTGRGIAPEATPQRTSIEDLDDAQLGQVIETDPSVTSARVLIDALYERAHRSMPSLFKSDGSANPGQFATANAARAIRSFNARNRRIGVQSALGGRYGEMLKRITDPKANVPIQTMRDMRTQIGRDLAKMQGQPVSLDQQALKAIYSGLSDDIQLGMRDQASRVLREYSRGSNHITHDMVVQARRSIDDLNRANDMTRMLKGEQEGVARMVRAADSNPSSATSRIVRAINEGGDVTEARRVLSMMRPEERQQVAAHVVRSLGEPLPSARGIVQEVGFSPSRFVTNYAKMNAEMRDMLLSGPHQKALTDLFNVANRLANVEALANHSRTFSNMQNVGLLTGGGALAMSDPTSALVIGGSMFGASVLMSTPQYTRWLAKYIALRARVRSGVDKAVAPLFRHVKQLDEWAKKDLSLVPVALAVNQDVAGEKGLARQ